MKTNKIYVRNGQHNQRFRAVASKLASIVKLIKLHEYLLNQLGFKLIAKQKVIITALFIKIELF